MKFKVEESNWIEFIITVKSQTVACLKDKGSHEVHKFKHSRQENRYVKGYVWLVGKFIAGFEFPTLNLNFKRTLM